MIESEPKSIALLFADVVDSTGLRVKHGETRYKAAFDLLKATVQGVIAEVFNNSPVPLEKMVGDGWMIDAGNSQRVVKLALYIRYRNSHLDWPPGKDGKPLVLRLRFGLHRFDGTYTRMARTYWITGPICVRVSHLSRRRIKSS